MELLLRRTLVRYDFYWLNLLLNQVIMAYVILIVSFLLVAAPAWFSYIEKKEERNKKEESTKKILLAVGILGGILSFYNGCDSYHKSEKSETLAINNDSIAKRNDSLYKNLLNKNLNAASLLINKQNKSFDTVMVLFDTSRSIINKQNTFLALQNLASKKLNTQIDSTSKILSYSRQTLRYVIGDTNIPVMQIVVANENNSEDMMMINYTNPSNNPILDLKVVLPKFYRDTSVNNYNVNGNLETFIGTLTKNYSPTVFSKRFPIDKNIFGLTPIGTVWRNGYYISFVYFKRQADGKITIEQHHYNGKGEFKMPN